MSDAPYTQFRQIQYRGPSTSDDYNARVEENYRDLMVLKNRARVTEEDFREAYSRLVKEHADVMRALQGLEQRVFSLENAANKIAFYDNDQVDTGLFDGTPFAVNAVDRCDIDTRHGLITLPKVDSSSLSKFSFVDTNGQTNIPSTLETSVKGIETTADSPDASIDTSAPEFALITSTGRIWQRNVIVGTTNANGAQMNLYVKVPTDLFTTPNSNSIVVHPFPLLGADILSVETTNKVDPTLDDTDGYTPLNVNADYFNNLQAVGWLAPGGWPGDEIVDAGPKRFIFDPRMVTGIRIGLGQRNFYRENGVYIYSYGASQLDLGFDKYLTTGKTMVRFDVPNTISAVSDVEAQIYNVAEAELPSVFSYRVIWETSFGSGSYTTTPVPFSNRVWIEVTLNTTAGGGSPALSGLTVTYP